MNDSVPDSILNTIKGMLGLTPDYTPFDNEIIAHINTFLTVLYQIGGTKNPVVIAGSADTWTAIFGTRTDLHLIKTWLYLRVRSVFDPSASSTIQQAFEETARELEWRINVEVDPETDNPLIAHEVPNDYLDD